MILNSLKDRYALAYIWEKAMAPHSSTLAWQIESDTTERLHFHSYKFSSSCLFCVWFCRRVSIFFQRARFWFDGPYHYFLLVNYYFFHTLWECSVVYFLTYWVNYFSFCLCSFPKHEFHTINIPLNPIGSTSLDIVSISFCSKYLMISILIS